LFPVNLVVSRRTFGL